MIDIDQAPDPHISDLPFALDTTYKYAFALKTTAGLCATNFQWLDVHNLKQIPLLDFDIICGAVMDQSIQKRLSVDSLDTDHSLLANYSGPNNVRFLLEMLQEFIIPPGTAAEILKRKRDLSFSLSSRSVQFLDHIKMLVSSNNPDVLQEGTDIKIKNLLIQDITQFADDLHDNALLDSLMDRATPIKDLLIGESPDKQTVEALRSSYAFLQTKRREKFSINNLNDALNAALVVRLFNSPNLQRPSGMMPVLISQTKAVFQLNDLSKEHLLVSKVNKLPNLFTDSMFLIVSEGLLAKTEGRYSVAVDAAKLLEEDSEGIVESCANLIQACRRIKDKGVRSLDIKIENLPKYEWEMLLFHKRLFEKRWGGILAPSQMADQRDVGEYLNSILSRNWKEILQPNDPNAFDTALNNMVQDLRTERPADYEIWNAIINAKNYIIPPITLNSGFDFYIHEDNNSLLREMGTGRLPNVIDTTVFEENHNIQVAVMPAYLACGAIVVVESFRELNISSKRYVQVTWLHRSTSEEILDLFSNILPKIIGRNEDLIVSVFTSRDEFTKECTQDTFNHELSALLTDHNDCECFKITHPKLSCFVDLLPLDGIEFQAGCTVGEEDWTKEFQYFLSKLICDSSEIPMPQYYVQNILNRVNSILKLDLSESSKPIEGRI